MKESPAYRAVVTLERLAEARLAACRADVAKLARRRYDLINRNALARQALLKQPSCTGFECAALFAHTAWTAVVAASLAKARSKELLSSATLAKERLHWARCRRGHERRRRNVAAH